jgi:hypothetical protein
MLYRCIGGIDIPSYRPGWSRRYPIERTKLKRCAQRNGGSYFYEMYRTTLRPSLCQVERLFGPVRDRTGQERKDRENR